MNPRGAYSQVAVQQLDDLEAASDMDLYNGILENCHLFFQKPKQAQSFSTAIATDKGILFQLPVPGFPPFKIFWSSEGPTIEAVFAYPRDYSE